MRASVSQYAVALRELSAAHTGKRLEKTLENFVAYLSRRGERKKLPHILEALERLENAERDILPLQVITAHEPSGALRTALERRAQALFPDKKIAYEFRVDREMMGGVAFRTTEALYDASLKTALKEFEKNLLDHPSR